MEYDKSQGISEFRNGLKKLNISLDDNQMEQFLDYYQLLIEWNKKINLTSIVDFIEVIRKHFIDSLSIVKVFSPHKEKILDLGTGAGFPGIPIKIAFPDSKIVLLDSLNKRIKFLDEVIRKLNLRDIVALHGRAEDFGKDDAYRETFDLCTSRAVAKLSTLSEYCIPFVKVGGAFISYKAGQVATELEEAKKAIDILGGRIIKTEEFELPSTDMSRSLVLIKKVSKTPKNYPRTAGKPTKDPL
ncbi:MAG: 16S rRNA (guanine(527)-N(7))-methyltransferase RsmG [Clostridiales bacterium]|nr:16S rRNA (guanine(527)-N(7))-methyltransferase RsmG [Clostridiales bacterium]